MSDAVLYDIKCGKPIYQQGKPATHFFCVQTGLIHVEANDEKGSPIFLGLYGPGDYFGEESLKLPRQSWRANAKAVVKETSVLSYVASSLIDRCACDGQLSNCIRDFGLELAIERQRLIEIYATHSSSPQKLFAVLWHFAQRIGVRRADGNVHMPPLTHELLRTLLGTTREFISINMRRLMRMGLLCYSRREIVLERDFSPSYFPERHRKKHKKAA